MRSLRSPTRSSFYVHEDLPHTRRVRLDLELRADVRGAQLQPLLPGLKLEASERVRDYGLEPHVFHFHLEAPGLDPRQIQNVVDQIEQVPAAPERVAEQLDPLGFVHAESIDDQVQETDDRVERRPKLVRGVREELALHPVGGAQALHQLLQLVVLLLQLRFVEAHRLDQADVLHSRPNLVAHGPKQIRLARRKLLPRDAEDRDHPDHLVAGEQRHVDHGGDASVQKLRLGDQLPRLHRAENGGVDGIGGVAVFLSALIELASAKLRPTSTEICFIALVDEESGQAGSRFLAKSGFKADLAIVGEPTRLQIVTAHKGDLWLQLETKGKAAHGSRPELGRNAVHLMAKIVHLLETDYARQLRQRRHALLRHATINVGAISGGRQPNIVPDWCAIRIDRRTIPGESDSEVKREILRFIRRHGLTASMLDTKNEEPAPPLETNPRLPLVQQFLRSAGQKKPAGVDFFTDAGVLAAAGIPCVVFGPGDIAQAHTNDEWVSTRELATSNRILHRFLESLP